ncbi:MAG: apolipoprotein N-acyltransferase [Verrucomicrobiota bacterium]|jgi:apolipoprotein N-acyltransferase
MTAPATSGERSDAWLVWAGTSLTALLLFFSFGPVGHPFCAFIALVPAALVAARNPDWKTWRRAGWVTGWVLWIGLLIWLRHVYPPLGWIGLVLLTAYCALYHFLWLLALRWLFPACNDAGLPARLLALLGLAGAWGLLEWTRSTFATGFGWLPFSASQVGNPVMLSLCAWVGPIGLSIVLVLFNLGFARWIVRLIAFYREENMRGPVGPTAWLHRLTPELYLGLLPVALAFLAVLLNADTKPFGTKDVRAGIVQTDFNPNAKWDSARLQDHIETIGRLTFAAASQKPDFILWPEAALPLSLESEGYLQRLTSLAKAVDTPLVIGAIDHRGAGYANGVAIITTEGLQKPVYAKRHLVPFGEYVPFADFLPLRKVVPIDEDCIAGTSASLLPLTTRRGDTFMAGALICYEDVFPELAREHALAGANLLIVITNDAWYGREAGAYQHVAHSILAAASTHLPMLRCGNAGWSGTIDAFGRATPLTEQGSIYFRGGKTAAAVQVVPGARQTFWVRHGDWAVGLGGVFCALAYVWRRRKSSAGV